MRGPGLFCVLALAGSLSLNAQTGVQLVSVSFPAGQSAKALDGRLLFLVSNDPTAEPRMQIDDTPRSQMVFGVTVDGMKPGQGVVVGSDTAGYPIRSLKDVPAGDYTVQVVLDVYETFHRADGKTIKLSPDRGEGKHWNLAPGNLYSKPRKVHVGPGGAPIVISMDQGDSADCGGEGHEICAAYPDTERVADEVLGDADVSECDCAGAGGF